MLWTRLASDPGEKKADLEQNRELLKQEIELLKPRLVVLVGKKAQYTIGNKARNEASRHYVSVPFPTKTRSPEKRKEANREYDELKREYEKRQDK